MREIIRDKKQAYFRANRRGRTEIITSIALVTGMGRKASIKALAREYKRRKWDPPETRGRPKLYTADTEAALAFVWKQYDFVCAERLIDEIPEAVRIFKRDKMWNYPQATTEQLLGMSLGAMKVRYVRHSQATRFDARTQHNQVGRAAALRTRIFRIMEQQGCGAWSGGRTNRPA